LLITLLNWTIYSFVQIPLNEVFIVIEWQIKCISSHGEGSNGIGLGWKEKMQHVVMIPLNGLRRQSSAAPAHITMVTTLTVPTVHCLFSACLWQRSDY